MSNPYVLTIPPTGDNPVVAGGVIGRTREVFRFEWQHGHAKLYVYPNRGEDIDLDSLPEFNERFPADRLFLVMDRYVGSDPADNKPDRAIVTNLLTHWIGRYNDGHPSSLQLTELRQMADRSVQAQADAKVEAQQQAAREKSEWTMWRARWVVSGLSRTLRRYALEGATLVNLWEVGPRHYIHFDYSQYSEDHDPYAAMPAAPKPEELSGPAKFIWEACQAFSPQIGYQTIHKCSNSEVRTYAIQILLRPDEADKARYNYGTPFPALSNDEGPSGAWKFGFTACQSLSNVFGRLSKRSTG
ncbi:MAG TPA: hypothetical protein V6D22_18710 [Candidatus Obscuribacterales bacterium]